MSLETGNRIADMVATNPVGATDFVSQGDDHIRLIKACIQGSFPSLGSTAVAVTAEKLNFTGGLTSDAQAQLDAMDAAKQPLDSDLSAIATLTTAAYGRDFLTLADNAALATKIAALVPTWTGAHVFNGADANSNAVVIGGSYGLVEIRGSTNATNKKSWTMRSQGDAFILHALDDAHIAGGVALTFAHGSGGVVGAMQYGNTTDNPAHQFYGDVAVGSVSDTARSFNVNGSATSNPSIVLNASGAEAFGLRLNKTGSTDAWGLPTGSYALQTFVGNPIDIYCGATAAARFSSGGVTIPRITPSTSTTIAKGQVHAVSTNVSLPQLAHGEWLMVQNLGGLTITVTKHASSIMYWGAIGYTGGTLNTVTLNSVGTLIAIGGQSGEVLVNGNIVGYT
jgi:hypothetical protein